jgi:long-subunit acyl-CoA synthetase (AMP-forming)
VLEYFHELGVELGEFYGMTETGAVTMTRPGIADVGTVGAPIPGYEIRPCDWASRRQESG